MQSLCMFRSHFGVITRWVVGVSVDLEFLLHMKLRLCVAKPGQNESLNRLKGLERVRRYAAKSAR